MKSSKPWKAEKPCSICKGRFKQACIICGWKRPKRAKVLTNKELLDRDAYREKIMLIDHYARTSAAHGNYTTQLPVTDREITEHRKFAQDLWYRAKDESVAVLAKKHNLTVNQVKRILATALQQQLVGHTDTLRPGIAKIDTKAIEEANRQKRLQYQKKSHRGTFSKMVDYEPDESNNGVS